MPAHGKARRTHSTRTYRQGQVVVLRVPFTGQGGWKLRPALVVSVERFHKSLPDLLVCPVSSQPRRFQKPGPGDHPLKHWKISGLHFPSTARVSNLLAVEKSLIKRVLGIVDDEDMARILVEVGNAFGLRA